MRIDNPPEEIQFHGHIGECRYCNGPVKMIRDQTTLQLVPDSCWCLKCGQRYFVIVTGPLEDFDLQQWQQKHD